MPEYEHDLNLIAALVEGRLDEQERVRLIEHLADCGQCRTVFAQLGRAAHDGSLSASEEGESQRELEAPHRARRDWSATRGWLPIAASLAVAVVAVRLFVGSPEDLGSSAPDSGASASGEAPISGDEELLRKRSGGRQVAGKVFRMTEGEWVDQSFDPAAAHPVVIVRGREERLDLLARVPALTPYAELGDRVLVMHEGTAYRFAP